MLQNDMHQYLTISIVQYEITCTNINIKCMIRNTKQKNEIKIKINQPIISIIMLTYIIITVQLII